MVDVFGQYESMKDNNVLMSFKGEVSFDLVKSILDVIEGRLEIVETNLKTKKKVFNILVEILQNLSHHIESAEYGTEIIDQGKTALLTVWTSDDSYIVTTGNYIPNENVDKLQSWLEEINKVAEDKEALRGLYKTVLNNNTFSAKGTAGLGFIDIARKSGQFLKFGFKPVDEKWSFFSFQINIPKEK